MRKAFLLCVTFVSFGLVQTATASWSVQVLVKRPFLSEHYDTTGQVSYDSLARYYPLRLTVFRSESESLFQADTTDDSGSAVFTFGYWADLTPVETTSISRMAVGFPNTYGAVVTFGQTTFVPVVYDSLDFKESEVELVLPTSVTSDEFTIGEGSYNICNFAVLNDMHVGEESDDFGSSGWNDYDDGTKQGQAVENDSNILLFLTQRPEEYPADFIVPLGDISSSSERSEYRRAKSLLTYFTAQERLDCPWLPIIGNHDMWPYTANSEPPEGSFPRGEIFKSEYGAYYDSFYYWFPNATSQLFWGYTPPAMVETWYFPAFFDLDGYRFVVGDFNSRSHAPSGHKGVIGSAEVDDDRLYKFGLAVKEARQQKRGLVILDHHPLNYWRPWIYNDPFSKGMRHELAGPDDDPWLRYYNDPAIPVWIGGHVHGSWFPPPRIVTVPDSIVDPGCVMGVANTLLDAAKDGVFGYFRVWDNVKASVSHREGPVPFPPVVTFDAEFFTTTDQTPTEYYWDFGDGTDQTAQSTWISHEFPIVARDSLYRVTVTIATTAGRHVSVADTVRIPAAGWKEVAYMPVGPSGKAVKDGGCLAYDAGTDDIYGSKGYKTGEFYAFDPTVGTRGTWTQKASVPPGTERKLPSTGSAICSDGNGKLYLTKGNNTQGFYEYNAAADSWHQRTDVPLGLSNKKVRRGTGLAWATRHDTGYVYLLKGYKNEFYRYDATNIAWTTLTPAPLGAQLHVRWDKGSWLVSDGDHTLYAFKSKYDEFYAYDTDADTWGPALTGMPMFGSGGHKKAKDGSAAAWYDGQIYAFKGGNTQEFWRYTPLGDSWHEQDSIPRLGSTGKKKVKAGGALAAYPGIGVFGLKGNKCLECWRFGSLSGGLDAGAPIPGRSVVASGGPKLDGETPLTDGLEASNPRWNPQGNRVCYSKDDTLTNYEAIYQCYYGLPIPEEKVTNMLEDCEEPVYSPSGVHIAFMVDDTVSDCYQLCVTTTSGGGGGGGGADAVPEEPTDCADAPGTTTAVAPAEAVPAGPVTPGGGVALRTVWHVTSAEADHCYPEWSPNGQWLCYERDDENNYTQIWRVPAFGGTEEQLTFGNSGHFLPSYLNSTEIVFTLSPNNDYDRIAKVNVSTHQATVISNLETDHDRPNPAANGNSVVAEALDDAGNTQIVKIPIWVGSESWLTSGTSDIMEPDYSQDNRSVFAVRWTGITSQIVCVDALYGGYSSVTDSLAIRDNPDGRLDAGGLTSSAVYEREAWSPLGPLLDGGGKRRPGSGIYLSRFRRPKDGPQGVGLGVLALDRAEPNPVTNRVSIRWQVPVEAEVSLRIYNTAGQLVRVLADGLVKPGAYTSVWNGTDAKGRRLANGVYFYALDNGAKRISRKLVLTD